MTNDDKDYLDLAFKGMKADLRADLNMVGYKVDQLNDRMDKYGGKISKNTNWRIRITAAVTAIASVVGFFIFKFGTILKTLKELINN